MWQLSSPLEALVCFMLKASSAGGSTILLGQRCVILPGKLILFADENFIKPHEFDTFLLYSPVVTLGKTRYGLC